jgi:hypothetical protein
LLARGNVAAEQIFVVLSDVQVVICGKWLCFSRAKAVIAT